LRDVNEKNIAEKMKIIRDWIEQFLRETYLDSSCKKIGQ